MMCRRCLVLAALLLWHGGATFYAVIVIPIGLEALDPPIQQTFVTQVVTRYLNGSTLPVLLLFAWDVLSTRDRQSSRRRWRFTAVALMALTLGVLVWLHPRIGALMDTSTLRISNRDALRPLHRVYLLVNGVQWIAGTLYAGLTLWAWRAEDRAIGVENERMGGLDGLEKEMKMK